MKYFISLCLLTVLFFSFNACVKTSVNNLPPKPDSTQTGLDSAGPIANIRINPTVGTYNDTITIHAANIGLSLYIMINGDTARNLGIRGDSIQVLVPPSAGSGFVTISYANDTKIAKGPQFTYLNLPYVITFAGNGLQTTDNGDGQPLDAAVGGPLGVAFDPLGNFFIAETASEDIRRIGTDSRISTYAGYGAYGDVNGPASSALFGYPSGVVADNSGNLYVTDAIFNKIRKIDPSGNVSTLAGDGSKGQTDGPGLSASFNGIAGITIDPQGDILVADGLNKAIRKITPLGDVSTITIHTIHQYLNGIPSTVSELVNPVGVCTDQSGNIYITDGNYIRKIDPTGDVTTIAGDRTDLDPNATFEYAAGIVFDSKGNLFVADFGSNQIKEVSSNGTVSLIAGYDWQAAGDYAFNGYKDATGLKARFYRPSQITIDKSGNLYVADSGNQRIRKVVLQ
jgi:sugar lactone lactonase YvrE